MPHFDSKKIATLLLHKAKDYFPSKVSDQLKKLYMATAILDFAVACVSIFEPIYLYTIGIPLYQIMLFYCGVYSIYFFVIPLGGRIAKERGFAHGIAYGSFFLVLYYLFLFATSTNHGFIFPAMIAFACQKACYWPGFHSEMAFFGKKKELGREVSGVVALSSLVSAAGPFLGGLIVAVFGFPTLFIVACSLILISNLPLFVVAEVFKPSTLAYTEPYKELIAPENRKYFFAFMGFAEELVTLGLWPIFVFITVDNIFEVGSIAAGVAVVAAIALVVIGRLADVRDRREMMTTGAVMYTLSWFVKLIVRTGGGIFMADFFSRLSKFLLVLPMVAGVYEHAMKTTHIVKTVLFFEMSLTVGKIVTAGSLALVFYIWGPVWHVAFIWAGFASMLYIILGRKDGHIARQIGA